MFDEAEGRFCDGRGLAGRRTYISWCVDVAAHYYDFLGSEEGLWVFGGGDGEVGEWANSDDGDGVGFVLSQESEDLLVSWDTRWSKESVFVTLLHLLCNFVWARATYGRLRGDE